MYRISLNFGCIECSKRSEIGLRDASDYIDVRISLNIDVCSKRGRMKIYRCIGYREISNVLKKVRLAFEMHQTVSMYRMKICRVSLNIGISNVVKEVR